MAKTTKRGAGLGAGADALFSTPAQPAPVAQPAPGAKEDRPIEFQKQTFPLRTDQIDELGALIAQIFLDERISLSKAAILRYGLSLALAAAKEDRGKFLQALQQLERDELEMNANRFYSLSPGLAGYRPK